MYHSITFGDKNTWDDWRIVPSSRPLFNPPALKKKTLDIPGANGLIDLSESLTGYPVYENREGSMEFIVMNDFKPWQEAYSDIMDYLHGRRMKAILEDDPNYYYEGRFTVNEWRSEQNWSRIVIDYSVEPYKWLVKSVQEWEWDPFNFETDYVPYSEVKNIPISTTTLEKTFSYESFGKATVCPTFIVRTDNHDGATVRFVDPKEGIDVTESLPEGSTQIPEIVFAGNEVTLYFTATSGSGFVTLDYRLGRL